MERVPGWLPGELGRRKHRRERDREARFMVGVNVSRKNTTAHFQARGQCDTSHVTDLDAILRGGRAG
jgi:hypothetical protein